MAMKDDRGLFSALTESDNEDDDEMTDLTAFAATADAVSMAAARARLSDFFYRDVP